MPPRKSKAASLENSSQPLPAPQKPSRAGRKRRHSDASNVSIQQSSAQIHSSNPGGPSKKRAKRTKVAVTSEDHEPLEGPDDGTDAELVMPGDHDPLKPTETYEEIIDEEVDEDQETIQVTPTIQPKQVHFHDHDHHDAVVDTATATHITPHPHKMTIKRRVTVSPSHVEQSPKLFKTISSRTSLPPRLSQEENSDPVTIIQELQYAPLRSVLDERIRRRLRRSGLSEQQNVLEDRDKQAGRTQKELEELRIEAAEKEARIQDLTLELETQRQFAIDVSDETSVEHDKVRAMEQELELLKNELREHMTPQIYMSGDNGVLDDQMMVLNSQEDITYAHLPTPEPSQVVIDGSEEDDEHKQSTTRIASAAKASWDEERSRFEDAIVALSREANDAKAELQILQIELESLGFGDETVSSKDVLRSIRTAFERVRESLELTMPGSVPEEASSEDVIAVLVDNVQDFAGRLREQDRQLSDKSKLISDLGNQIQSLLDHLAEAEIRKSTLQQQWRELDETNESTARELEDVEEELEAVQEERNGLQQDLDAKVDEYKSLSHEHDLSVKNVERLATSLEHYRKVETDLTQTIMRMEEEHRESVTKMNREREMTLRDLEDRLDAETVERGMAEQLCERRQTTIDELQERIGSVESERDSLLERIAAAEAEGEARGADIEDLQNKVHEQGTQANELRQKLFEVQQQNEDKIGDLEALMSERDQKFQADFAEEIARREATVASLNADIAHLQTTLSDLETEKAGLERRVEAEAEQMLDFQNEKADEIEELKQTIHDKQAAILVVEEKAIQADQRWQEVLTARDEEIEMLRSETELSTTEKHSLAAQLNTLKTRFQDYIRTSQERMFALQNAVATVQTVAEDEGNAHANEGDAALEELEAMEIVVADLPKHKSTVRSTSTKKFRGVKRRNMDSGIGLDEEEEDEDEDEDELALAV